MSSFLMGVNYWPRRSAMYMWERFDLGEIREDMARMRSLGLDVVRFFLLWEAFQPSPDRMDGRALARFDAVMDAIAHAGLRAMPTLFCGHMSGCNWLPAWTLDHTTRHGRFRTITQGRTSPYGIGDFYADAGLVDAQRLFARSVAERAGDHRALYCWDLGNEFSNLREPNSPPDAAEWSARLTDELRRFSSAPVTGGTHGEDVERDRRIRPSSIAEPWHPPTMHGYSVYSTFSRGRLDTNVVPFYLELMQSFTGKAVFFSEFGNPTCPPGMVSPYDRVPLPGEPALPKERLPKNAAPYACLTEDEMAWYATDVLQKLLRAGATGALWWCWADYAIGLAAWPPFDRAFHELHFGIVRNDGTDKPVARVLETFAKARFATMAPAPPIARERDYYSSLPEGLYDLYRGYARTH